MKYFSVSIAYFALKFSFCLDREDGKEERREIEGKTKSTRKDQVKPNIKQIDDRKSGGTANDDESSVQVLLTSDQPEKSGQIQESSVDDGVPKKKQSVEHYDAAIGIT